MCKENPRIYFEDEYCAVVYKASGENAQTFFTQLFPHKRFITPANRLDTPVSGIMLLAFSAQIQTLLSRAFETGAIQKEYWAICEHNKIHTVEESDTQRLEHWLGFHTKTQKAFIGAAPSDITKLEKRNKKPALKKAVLYWTLCGKGDKYDFIRINPETGRTHQIRIQMAASGRPIKGDLKYGARRSDPAGGIRLHSVGLCFIHPISGRRIAVKAPPLQPDTLWKACTEACLTNEPFTNEPQTDTAAAEGAPTLINSEQRL